MLSLTSETITPLHAVAPGPKIVALAAVTALAFSLGGLGGHAALLAAVALAYVVCGWRFAQAGARLLRPLVPFVVLVLAWHLWTGDVAGGLRIAARMIALVALANLVTMTTRLSEMIDLLAWVLRPLRPLGLPVGAIGLSVALFVRFIPTLADRVRHLSDAWRARSPRRPGWRIVVPMVLVALDDADHVADALRARGGVPDD